MVVCPVTTNCEEGPLGQNDKTRLVMMLLLILPEGWSFVMVFLRL